jgi:hypothetical protein
VVDGIDWHAALGPSGSGRRTVGVEETKRSSSRKILSSTAKPTKQNLSGTQFGFYCQTIGKSWIPDKFSDREAEEKIFRNDE